MLVKCWEINAIQYIFNQNAEEIVLLKFSITFVVIGEKLIAD